MLMIRTKNGSDERLKNSNKKEEGLFWDSNKYSYLNSMNNKE
jgi:hypothetical protein